MKQRRSHVPALLLLALLLALCPAALSAREVVLATTNWEPYIGPSLPQQGYVAEVARLALARSGHSLRLLFLPWPRAVHMARQGKVDGYLPEYDSPALRQEFLFSAPLPGGPVGFFRLRGQGPARWNGLDSLASCRIGVVRGYVNAPEFDARADLRKDMSTDDATNLRKLMAGRIDLMVADRHVGYALARRLFPGQVERIEFLSPSLEEKALFVCFPRQNPAAQRLRRDFDRGLAELARQGILARLRARHGFR